MCNGIFLSLNLEFEFKIELNQADCILLEWLDFQILTEGNARETRAYSTSVVTSRPESKAIAEGEYP